jgi:hypothetical protein
MTPVNSRRSSADDRRPFYLARYTLGDRRDLGVPPHHHRGCNDIGSDGDQRSHDRCDEHVENTSARHYTSGS